MQNFTSLLSQYKTIVAVVTLAIIGLAVPITLNLVGQQQDLQQRASAPTQEYLQCLDRCDIETIDGSAEESSCRASCSAAEDEGRCLQDTKECPDGTLVGRDSSRNCEFELCPVPDIDNPDPCAVAIDEKPNGCSCVPNSAYCKSGYCSPDTRKCENPPSGGGTTDQGTNDNNNIPDPIDPDPGTDGGSSGGTAPVIGFDRNSGGTNTGGTSGSTSTSSCVGRVSYFVVDPEGNRVYDSGITVDVSGPAGNFKAQPIPLYNNTTHRLAIESLPEGNYTAKINLNGYHLIELDGTNHGQFFTENSLRVECPAGRTGVTLIMYADLIVSEDPPQNLTCGNRCSSDANCAGGTDGCGTCSGTETELRFRRGTCTDGTVEPTVTPANACGTSCSSDSACSGASDGCTECVTDFRSSFTGSGTCQKPATTPSVTPKAACGSTCDSNSTCTGASDGCTVCAETGGGETVCTTPTTPTPTVTPTGTATCGKSCTSDASCSGNTDGCGVCADNGQGGQTCQRQGVTPTPTIGANDTAVRVNAKMPGIGQQTGDNPTPQNPNRTASVEVFNTNNQKVANGSGTAQFNGTDTYTGLINLGSSLQSGTYYATIKFDNTLNSRIPGVFQITKGQETNLTLVTLIPGDVDQNNVLDIKDYNIFLNCFGENQCNAKSLSDFNDNGSVEPVDYNILLRSFAIRPGD